MDKNIKRLISEAFNELFDEMVNEAPQTLRKKGMTADEIESVVNRALRLGYDTRLAYDFESGTEQEENFNIVIDRLIETYLTSKNPQEKENAKSAIQSAFSPENEKFKNLFRSYRGRADFEDMISSAYETSLIRGFDNLMRAYKRGSGTFGGLVKNDVQKDILDYVKGGYGAGRVAAGDVYRGGSQAGQGMISLSAQDKNDRGNEEKIGDYDEELEDIGDEGPESFSDAPETEFKGRGKIDVATGRELVDYMINWFEDRAGDPEYPDVTPIRATIFKEFIHGADAKQIWEDNPEINQYFPDPKPLTQEFRRLTKSEAGKELSWAISQILGINYDLSEVDPTELKQIYSQNPSFASKSTDINEKSSDEMLKIQGDIQNLLDELGYSMAVDAKVDTKNKDGEFTKFTKIFQDLEDNGMMNQAKELHKLLNKHEDAKRIDSERGGYGTPKRYVPTKASQETDEFGGMFEGVNEKDLNRLMERVLRRLSM